MQDMFAEHTVLGMGSFPSIPYMVDSPRLHRTFVPEPEPARPATSASKDISAGVCPDPAPAAAGSVSNAPEPDYRISFSASQQPDEPGNAGLSGPA